MQQSYPEGCSGQGLPGAHAPHQTPLAPRLSCLQTPLWLHWLQWPQRLVLRLQHERQEEEARQQREQQEAAQRQQEEAAESAWVNERAAELLARARALNERLDRTDRSMERCNAMRRSLVANQAAPPAPSAAAPWLPPPAVPAPGTATARSAAADALAAAAVSWASTAAGHEAAAHAAAQRAENQPAAHGASVATEWGRAAAAWRAAHDALDAAHQADPGAESVQRAAAAVEAARAFGRQMLSQQE